MLAVAVSAANGDNIDQETARRLVQERRILPLAEIVDAVRKRLPGEVLGVELEVENGAYVYEFKVLKPDGSVQEVEVEAATGKVIGVEGDD
jgi:uncharacterized membrane protein YkoI